MLIDVAENQTKARGRLDSVTMVTTAGSSEESYVGDGKPLGLRGLGAAGSGWSGVCSHWGHLDQGLTNSSSAYYFYKPEVTELHGS